MHSYLNDAFIFLAMEPESSYARADICARVFWGYCTNLYFFTI